MASTAFVNPRPVVISGYTGTAMQDPQLSAADGSTLFFDSHHDVQDATPTDLHYAVRTGGPTEFSYVGKPSNANVVNSAQFTGSVDASGEIIWFQQQALVIYNSGVVSGTYANGAIAVDTAGPIRSLRALPLVDGSDKSFLSNPYLTPDGKTLALTNWWSNSGVLVASKVVFATRIASQQVGATSRDFILTSDTSTLEAVNSISPKVYSLALHPNKKLVVFTAVTNVGPQIFVATAAAAGQPFVNPQILQLGQPSGLRNIETGNILPDGSGLYFHQILSSTSSRIFFAPAGPV